jgi:hypothetical protein
MSKARFILTLLLAMTVSATAWAQDAKPITNADFGVTITPPEKWEVAQGNDKSVASFKHAASGSHIEVIGTKLLSADVHDVFYNTFHKTLKESNFEATEEKADAKVGETETKKSTYKFTHSGITLEVVIHEFTKNDVAWLVVGYIQDSEAEKFRGEVDNVIKTMKFSEN